MPAQGRIAYVGADRQIHVVDPDGRDRRPVTFSKTPSALSRWGAGAGEDAAAWPCWSPDGRYIACFQRLAEGTGPNVVTSVEVDGIDERALVDLGERQPICAAWSPRGDRLAVLAEGKGALELITVRRDGSAEPHRVATGSPLFFTWAPDGAHLLLHLGSTGAERSRLVFAHAEGASEPRVLPDPPGSFCTPLFTGARAVYVTRHLGAGWVSLADPDLSRSAALTFFEGLLAVLPSPLGGQLAVGAAPGGEGTPYMGVWRVPLDGGSPQQIISEACLAFLWDPLGRHLIFVTLEAGCARWRLAPLDGGATRDLAAFWPSRDLLFHLHFFEQFASSHALLSPDGGTLVYAGFPSASAARDPETCRVYTLQLGVSGAVPSPVAEGSYAVFSPA